MAGNSRDSGRAVTARALSVLTAFDAGHTRQTLTEIARRADIPLATAHRLVGELERWGALQRDRGGTYVVGLRLWELGRLCPVHTDLQRIAAPVMGDLRDTTGAGVHLAIRDGVEVVYVEQLDRPGGASPNGRPGARRPLHATGAGRVLLANAPPALVDEYLAGARVDGDGVDVARLGQELREVRDRDYALVPGNPPAGGGGAVPVRDGSGIVAASLGLDVPADDSPADDSAAHEGAAHEGAAHEGAADEGAGGGGSSMLVGPLVSAAGAIGRGLADGPAGGRQAPRTRGDHAV